MPVYAIGLDLIFTRTVYVEAETAEAARNLVEPHLEDFANEGYSPHDFWEQTEVGMSMYTDEVEAPP